MPKSPVTFAEIRNHRAGKPLAECGDHLGHQSLQSLQCSNIAERPDSLIENTAQIAIQCGHAGIRERKARPPNVSSSEEIDTGFATKSIGDFEEAATRGKRIPCAHHVTHARTIERVGRFDSPSTSIGLAHKTKRGRKMPTQTVAGDVVLPASSQFDGICLQLFVPGLHICNLSERPAFLLNLTFVRSLILANGIVYKFS